MIFQKYCRCGDALTKYMGPVTCETIEEAFTQMCEDHKDIRHLPSTREFYVARAWPNYKTMGKVRHPRKNHVGA